MTPSTAQAPALSPQMQALADRGLVVDEWSRWQQGDCGTYAAALIKARPHLSLGSLAERHYDEDDEQWYDDTQHFFAYDEQFAYDSAGRHPMPYVGIDPSAAAPEGGAGIVAELFWEHGDFGLEVPVTIPDADLPARLRADLAAALDHAVRHGILPG